MIKPAGHGDAVNADHAAFGDLAEHGGLGVGDHDVYGKFGRARPDERVILAAEEGVPLGCGDGIGLMRSPPRAAEPLGREPRGTGPAP